MFIPTLCGIGNHTENAPSTILRQVLAFSFSSSEIDFFKNCAANCFLRKGCFANDLEAVLYLQLFHENLSFTTF